MIRQAIDIQTNDGPIRLSWLEWPHHAPERTVVCVHGLTRNAHDFEIVAAYLNARGARVLSLDIVGRGDSSRLEDPAGYQVPNYAAHVLAWCQAVGLSTFDWIGTSMGGLIGMAIAIRPDSPIRAMVLNDIGPFIPAAALNDIADYVGMELSGFDTLENAVAYARNIHAGFGNLTHDQWRLLGEKAVQPDDQGRYRLKYDPAIRDPIKSVRGQDFDAWPLYEMITCPVLVIRGAQSTLLPREVAEDMTQRGPKASLYLVEDAGHAPALMAEDQCAAIANWLSKQ